jgi:hypothetical protein
MKKLALFLSLVSLSAISQAQKSIIFKHKILPNHTYTFTRTDGFDMDATPRDTSAKDTGTNVIKSIQLKSIMQSGSTAKTTVANSSRQIPVTMTCTKSSTKITFNGNVYPTPESNPGEGESLSGLIDPQFNVHVDTTTATADIKAAAQAAIGDIPTQIKFPDTEMKIGDTFTEDESITNLDIPGFDKTKEYMMKVTYKLTAIKDNLGYFDTSSTFDMNVNQDVMGHHIAMTSKGSGNGKMIFDIAKAFPQSITRDFTMTVDVENKPMKLGMKVKISRDEKVAVSAN